MALLEANKLNIVEATAAARAAKQESAQQALLADRKDQSDKRDDSAFIPDDPGILCNLS